MIFCPQRYNTKRRLSSVFRNFLSGCQSKGCVFRFYNCFCELLIFDAVFRRKARISPAHLRHAPAAARFRRPSFPSFALDAVHHPVRRAASSGTSFSPVNAVSATRSVERNLQRTPVCLRGRRNLHLAPDCYEKNTTFAPSNNRV